MDSSAGTRAAGSGQRRSGRWKPGRWLAAGRHRPLNLRLNPSRESMLALPLRRQRKPSCSNANPARSKPPPCESTRLSRLSCSSSVNPGDTSECANSVLATWTCFEVNQRQPPRAVPARLRSATRERLGRRRACATATRAGIGRGSAGGRACGAAPAGVVQRRLCRGVRGARWGEREARLRGARPDRPGLDFAMIRLYVGVRPGRFRMRNRILASMSALVLTIVPLR